MYFYNLIIVILGDLCRFFFITRNKNKEILIKLVLFSVKLYRFTKILILFF